MTETEPARLGIIAAIDRGDVNHVCQLLTTHPALLSENNYSFGTWLHRAAEERSIELVDLLLKLGCDINAETPAKNPTVPLWNAIRKDNPAMVQALLERGANPNHEPSRLIIAAIVGSKKNSLEMIKLLDQYGADLHTIWFDKFGAPPINALSTAIGWDQQEVVEYLGSRGCTLPPEPEKPPVPEPQGLDDEVRAFFAELYGPVQKLALTEIVPTTLPPVSVQFIPPSRGNKCVTLFTTGLSEHVMDVPAGKEDYARAELFIQLPSTWKFRLYEDMQWGWPHHWLRTMSQYPHERGTWFGGPVLVVTANEPVVPDTTFAAMLLLAEKKMTSRAGDTIWMYRLMPLYREEAELVDREDVVALFQAFDRASISFVVDSKRKNVALGGS